MTADTLQSVADLREKAKRKIPKFAFEYIDGGCNEDVNLHKNTAKIRNIELLPYYLNKHNDSKLRTILFGQRSVGFSTIIGMRQTIVRSDF